MAGASWRFKDRTSEDASSGSRASPRVRRSGRSTWTTCARAWTPESVRPAQVIEMGSGARLTRCRASASDPATVGRPVWVAKPRKPLPSYAMSSRHRTSGSARPDPLRAGSPASPAAPAHVLHVVLNGPAGAQYPVPRAQVLVYRFSAFGAPVLVMPTDDGDAARCQARKVWLRPARSAPSGHHPLGAARA